MAVRVKNLILTLAIRRHVFAKGSKPCLQNLDQIGSGSDWIQIFSVGSGSFTVCGTICQSQWKQSHEKSAGLVYCSADHSLVPDDYFNNKKGLLALYLGLFRCYVILYQPPYRYTIALIPIRN
jgi:hypothetical protein